jgi:alkylresorcinol/alkylpyrone synthase
MVGSAALSIVDAVTRIAAARGVLPAHRYPQQQITEQFAELVLTTPERRALLERLHASTGIVTRHLALPLPAYLHLDGFGAANDAFIEAGVALGLQAVREALDAAGLVPSDVDVIVSTTVTGLAVPSLDARLVGPLGLRPDVRRVPLFGLGCVAGAAGVARAHDLLRGDPDGVAVLLSVELCSLTVQRDDESLANMVGSGLFGDGAAAVVLVGDRRAEALAASRGVPVRSLGPAVVATRSRFYPDTERVMGWDVGGSGFRIVLAPTVADVVETHLGEDADAFLMQHGLTTGDVRRWVAHPGGPRVLEAMQRALDLPAGALQVTWDSLASVGNLSSSSVLHVLDQTLRRDPAGDGAPALMLALGPGFCAELVLLEW